ncbi:MAG TPA: TetR/AcrR family transcriptional regulator [Acidimicrobiia bacterium]|nr:TetR/AcrR family transcriptional regulator [Acidimicrobiia bacterium]
MSGPPPPIASPGGSRRLCRGDTPQPPGSRREAILAAALELFRRRGFHSVGIDEIGTLAGISGPGVYRHFPSKSSLLVALFDSLSERMLVAAEEIQKVDCPPEEALDRLVGFHVTTAVAERDLLAVWLQDAQSLPRSDQERIARRQVEYIAVWEATLARLRPELGPAEAQTVVHAALGAINSIAFHDPGVPPEALEALLGDAARAVLGEST